MENFFEGAKFGDKFIDNVGKIYIYHYCENHKSSDGKIWCYHYLMREPVTYYSDICQENIEYHPYDSYVFKDGYGVMTNLKYYPIENIKNGPNKDYLICGKYYGE